MKKLLAILTALLLCFFGLPLGEHQALGDGADCFVPGTFPTVYNDVLKRDFLTALTMDPNSGDLQFFPYQLMYKSQDGSSELYATSDGKVRLSFLTDGSGTASSLSFTVPTDYDTIRQNAYILSFVRALSSLDASFNQNTATMLMLTAGSTASSLDVSMGQMTAQLQEGEYVFTLARSGAPAVTGSSDKADTSGGLQNISIPSLEDLLRPAVTDPPAAPAETAAPVYSGGSAVMTPGSVIFSAGGVEMVYQEISYAFLTDEVDLKVKYTITNNSGKKIILNTGASKVNGVSTSTVGISILEDGQSEDDQLYIEPVDSASQKAICNPSSLSVALTLKDGSNYKEMATGELNMSVSLPSTTPEPNSKFPIDSSSSSSSSVQPVSGAVNPGDTVMNVAGVEVRYNGIQHVVFTDEVDLKVMYSVINNSGKNIVLNTGDTYVNGVSANTVGISVMKPGEATSDQAYIEPVDAASQNAICNPSSLSIELTLKDGDTYTELGKTTFSLSNISLPSVTPKPGSKFPSGSTPTATPKPTAKPTVKPSSVSKPRPLNFPDSANGQWQNVGTNQLKFRCQVKNTSGSDTIRAFELYLYPTDVWGNRLIGSDEVYYHTTTKQIKPGQTTYSDYFTIGSRSETANIYVGIKRVVLTDGTVYEYDDVEYWNWTIK